MYGEIFGKRRVYQSKLRLPRLPHCVKVVARAPSLENELLFPRKIEIETGGKRDCLPIKLIEIRSESSFRSLCDESEGKQYPSLDNFDP